MHLLLVTSPSSSTEQLERKVFTVLLGLMDLWVQLHLSCALNKIQYIELINCLYLVKNHFPDVYVCLGQNKIACHRTGTPSTQSQGCAGVHQDWYPRASVYTSQEKRLLAGNGQSQVVRRRLAFCSLTPILQAAGTT